MSLIIAATLDNKGVMIADKLVSCNELRVVAKTPKAIHLPKQGFAVGGVGELKWITDVMGILNGCDLTAKIIDNQVVFNDWLLRHPEYFPQEEECVSELIIVTAKSIVSMNSSRSYVYPYQKFFAIGSASHIALGALEVYDEFGKLNSFENLTQACQSSVKTASKYIGNISEEYYTYIVDGKGEKNGKKTRTKR